MRLTEIDREIDRTIGTATTVLQEPNQSIMAKLELNHKTKLSTCLLIHLPTSTYGHDI